MNFDIQTKLSADARTKILTALTALAAHPPAAADPASRPSGYSPTKPQPRTPRNLSLFELARLHRELQNSVPSSQAPELLRQVVWSVQLGALKHFDTRHALNIALKKIREGLWSRPNRMPPNWTHTLPETCRAA